MGKTLVIFAALVLAVAAFPSLASAQSYPRVAGLKAFTAQTNFMSLPGYLRYLVHQRTSQWLSYAEAARVTQQQTGQ